MIPEDGGTCGADFRIFIVEDEAIVADDLAATLEGFGYCVAGMAKSAETAIAKIAVAAPDLILMDIHHLAGGAGPGSVDKKMPC
jgi:CheY-like chemotaxis protein